MQLAKDRSMQAQRGNQFENPITTPSHFGILPGQIVIRKILSRRSDSRHTRSTHESLSSPCASPEISMDQLRLQCPMFGSHRIVRASASLLLAGASLLGCTVESGHPSIAPTESRNRMLAFVDDTVAVLGSTGWREVSGAYLQTCRLDGGEGVDYGYARIGPASADPRHDAAVVEDFWKSRGYKTKLTHSSNPKDTTLQLFGAGTAVKSIRYSADAEGTSFSVESECIPGDFGTIVDSGDF
jgi:hypothetical protein